MAKFRFEKADRSGLSWSEFGKCNLLDESFLGDAWTRSWLALAAVVMLQLYPAVNVLYIWLLSKLSRKSVEWIYRKVGSIRSKSILLFQLSNPFHGLRPDQSYLVRICFGNNIIHFVFNIFLHFYGALRNVGQLLHILIMGRFIASILFIEQFLEFWSLPFQGIWK